MTTFGSSAELALRDSIDITLVCTSPMDTQTIYTEMLSQLAD